MTEQLLLPVESAARALGLGKTKVYELIARGELETVTIGRARRVPVASLANYVAGLRGGASA